jgi:arginyl-tRNA synthetase
MNDYLIQLIEQTLKSLYPDAELPEVKLEKPRIAEHGDLSTNIAMNLARPLKKNPRAVAEELVAALPRDPQKLASVEIAGPGFINFRFAADWLYNELKSAIDKGADFGKGRALEGLRYQIEFVSANPTGPLTVGHGRNAVLGDTIARLFEWAGASVEREYYFNNAGRQMRVLGNSVAVRYQQLLGREIELPDDSYEGEYIIDIAQSLVDQNGDRYIDDPEHPIFKETAEKLIFDDISRTLDRMNIRMDTYFNENNLYENGAIEKVLKLLEEKNLIYKKDGATWFRTTNFGKEKDTVLVKSTGEPTYRLPDIAYHSDKLDRGFDRCIDIFGADHIATYPDILSALEVLGYDRERVDVLVYQFVTIVADGKPYKMSTRKANFVTLDELMDEVGPDVTRFFFLMRSPGTHLEFDIAQAKESGEKNPVFYLQYAHARIKSIMRKVREEMNIEGSVDLTLLQHDTEVRLIRDLLDFPDWVMSAAMGKEPHRLINYLNEVAADFHRFYHDCRILGEDPGLAHARVSLLEAVATVMSNGLGILGIEAPDRM